VAFARTHLQWRGWRGWCEVFLLQLMSQLIRDLDFGIGSEANRRITVLSWLYSSILSMTGSSYWKERTRSAPSHADLHIVCQQ
jgi:hypothetical protein